MKNDNTVIIVIIAILILLGGFGMVGFGGMMHGYGSDRLCGTTGGIWCYWPNWSWVFNAIMSVLVITVLVLLIILLIRKINEKGGRK